MATEVDSQSRSLWDRFPRWLHPPVFEDEDKTHQALLLHVVLCALVLVPLPYVLGVAIKTPELTGRAVVQGLSGEAANVALLLLLRAGHVQLASLLQVCAFFVFMTASALTGAGIHGQPYQMGYPLVIVIAGILLGVRGAVVTTVAALMVGLLMLVQDSPRSQDKPPGIWIVSAVIFPVIATLQYLSERTVRRALSRATVTLEARHRAERALRESEERFRTLAEASFEGIMIHEGGIIREVNRRFAEVFGYADRSELVGKNGFSDLLSPESTSALRRGADSAVAGTVEVVGVRKDGSRFPGETLAREIEYQGRASRVVAMRDITDRKRAEHERTTLEQQLAQAKRLESVGRLAAGVAHDFNNLLTCVMGNASIVQRTLPPRDSSLELLEEVIEAAKKAARLTRELLAVGRQEMAAPVRLNPNRVIEGIKAMLARMMGEHVQIETVLASTLPPVLIDPSQLERILVNLCVNARDAMPQGGRIEIRTEVAPPTEKRADTSGPGGEPDGDVVRICVSDNGIGMSQEVLDRIFEPFFTTKEPGKGTGLGLASVHGIVSQNHGFVRVESEPGVGSRFFVAFPRAGD